jgi:NAD(P)-dependent dehydrogenase (short-subunit alcohol dehydrogenase family)
MAGRIALVTGGNRGIGFEVCRQLVQAGVRVIMTSRNEEAGLTAVGELDQGDNLIHFVTLDVTDNQNIADVADQITSQYGRLDILINNAGVYIDDSHSLLELKSDILRTTMETNVYGPLFLTQVFVPLMIRNNYGRIVNVSSSIGQLSNLSSRWPAYRLSKILLNLQTRIIAQELTGSNILINAVCPGWVRTDMGGANAPRSVEQGADTIFGLATLPDNGPQGGYFRDRKPLSW